MWPLLRQVASLGVSCSFFPAKALDDMRAPGCGALATPGAPDGPRSGGMDRVPQWLAVVVSPLFLSPCCSLAGKCGSSRGAVAPIVDAVQPMFRELEFCPSFLAVGLEKWGRTGKRQL